MSPGIRAELKVPAAIGCPIARISAAHDRATYSVSKSANPEFPNRVTEEFTLEKSGDTDPSPENLGMQEAFDSGSETIFRFERTVGQNCPCECVESHGYPVIDARGEDGTLYLTFHAPDQDALREVIASIDDYHPQVEVRRLVQSRDGNDEAIDSLVFFDKTVLTDRQAEVLETAHEYGYFDHPKGANAGEIAQILGITTATFTEHLSAAHRKLLDFILDPE